MSTSRCCCRRGPGSCDKPLVATQRLGLELFGRLLHPFCPTRGLRPLTLQPLTVCRSDATVISPATRLSPIPLSTPLLWSPFFGASGAPVAKARADFVRGSPFVQSLNGIVPRFSFRKGRDNGSYGTELREEVRI